MTAKKQPTPLFSRQQRRDHIARVVEATAGLAITISLADRVHRVAGHLSQVEALQPGDRVLVSETECGYVITGRLRGPAESVPPRLMMDNGTLSLEADEAVRLQAGKSLIEIRADGSILIDGTRIKGHADGPMRFEGAIIEFN